MKTLDGLNLLVIDFESYLNRKEGFDLKKISVTEYVRDQRFKVHGYGYMNPQIDSVAEWTRMTPRALVDWSKTAVIAHNVVFDGFILAEKYGIRPALWVCTKAMSRAILGNSVPNHSLKYLAEHFGLPRKGEMKTDGLRDLTPEQEAELADYCKSDVEICAQLFEIFRKDFPASQYEAMDWTVRAFVEPKLRINVPLITEEYEKEKQRREAFFLERDKRVYSSNQKFAGLLAGHGYEVPTKKSPRTGLQIPALALGDTEFLGLLESEDETLRTLCEARVAAKSNLMETRSAKFAKVGATGPWPFDVQFSGAMQTHRYSGGGGAGGNPQNLTACRKHTKEPHECKGSLRKCVEAPEGHMLLVVDFSAVERRIQSWLSCDPISIEAFTHNKDIYSQFAARFFGRPIDKKNNPEERQFGKTCELGLGYGMGWEKFIRQVKVQTGRVINKDDSVKAIDLFRHTYTGIRDYWDYLDRLLAKIAAGETGRLNGLPAVTYGKNHIKLPSGLAIKYTNLRRVGRGWVFDRYETKGRTLRTKHIYGAKVLENICQALAGEICKESIARVEKLGIEAKGQLHDEAVAVVPEADAEDGQIVMEREFSRSPEWWPHIKLAAECGIGRNWLEAK